MRAARNFRVLGPLSDQLNNERKRSMKKLLLVSAAAMFACGTALAQPASPVPGSQPGTKAPGSELPKQTPGATGSGSAPIGPPASTPSTTPSTPGTPSVPGKAPAPDASKKLDTPSAGGGSK
jgi:hypothetical protein